MATKLERDFQSGLIKDLKTIFPGCIVMKNDASYIQGIPDLLVLYKDKWATLENKKSSKAHKQPNQEYYVGVMDEMSFSRFIFPENKNVVLKELERFFNEGRH
nr:MAG TPA: hydrolase [Bacteriophage sp.]